MARKKYRVTYGGDARRTLAGLSDVGKAAVKAKEKELERDPHHAGTYDERDKQYHGTFVASDGGEGIIRYVIEEGYVTVYVLRIAWKG